MPNCSEGAQLTLESWIIQIALLFSYLCFLPKWDNTEWIEQGLEILLSPWVEHGVNMPIVRCTVHLMTLGLGDMTVYTVQQQKYSYQ